MGASSSEYRSWKYLQKEHEAPTARLWSKDGSLPEMTTYIVIEPISTESRKLRIMGYLSHV